MKRGVAIAAIASAIPIPFAASAIASPGGDTDPIYGRAQCESLARRYQAAGYSASCYPHHGDWYYVHFSPRAGG
ncbi:hypothetical protein AB0L57_15160 [Nocardia sp. NPDC052254]|uniref:hypothetical protein n=1 Tax=Nocardia sp. NPDC052254 TaxID=3155681 RepID=UPI0034418B4D